MKSKVLVPLVAILVIASCQKETDPTIVPSTRQQQDSQTNIERDDFGPWNWENEPSSSKATSEVERYFAWRAYTDHENIVWEDPTTYVQEFKDDYVLWGGEEFYPVGDISTQKGTVVIKDLNSIGIAYYICTNGYKIELDREWWQGFIDKGRYMQLMAVMYHEMGHDLLNMGHKPCSSGNPSINFMDTNVNGPCWPRNWEKLYKAKFNMFKQVAQHSKCHRFQNITPPLSELSSTAQMLFLEQTANHTHTKGEFKGWNRIAYKNEAQIGEYGLHIWSKAGENTFSVVYKDSKEIARFAGEDLPRILTLATARAYADKYNL